jgi:hypothetical protein
METITKTIYYRVTDADGDMYQSESLEYVMTNVPKTYKRTTNIKNMDHLSYKFEKLEQTIVNDETGQWDDTELLDECYFVRKIKFK